jgi:hypothetical protein
VEPQTNALVNRGGLRGRRRALVDSTDVHPGTRSSRGEGDDSEPEEFDIAVVEGSRAGYLVAVPLQYLFRTQILLYSPDRISDALVLADAVTDWSEEGREVFYFSPWPAGPSPIGNVKLQWLDHVLLTTALPSANWSGPPRGREWLSLSLYVHRFTAAESPFPSTYAYVGIGEDDFGRVEGFYGPETGAGSGEAYRWTGQKAKILFPPLASAGPLMLRMRLSAPRSQGDAPAVKVYVSGHLAGEVRPSPEWREYEVFVPSADPNKATVVLESDVWNPLHAGFSTDDRYLGVRVDWARLEVAG